MSGIFKVTDVSVSGQAGLRIMSEDGIKNLMIDSWRLMFAHEKIIEQLPPQQQRAAYAKARHLFPRILLILFQLAGDIRLVVFEGKSYVPNYPIEAVNAEDFEGEDDLIVVTTLEPALVQRGRVLHSGKVVLARKEDCGKE